jgi:hypothetical protein
MRVKIQIRDSSFIRIKEWNSGQLDYFHIFFLFFGSFYNAIATCKRPGLLAVAVSHCYQSQPLDLDRTVQIKTTVK